MGSASSRFLFQYKIRIRVCDGEKGHVEQEALIAKFGTGLSLIAKYSVVVEVLTSKDVNDNGFIDQFTNLWRGRDRVSIRALGGLDLWFALLAERDMSRVLKAGKSWIIRDDLVLVVDGSGVQLHNVPSFSMTEAVAMEIRGLIGRVFKVDKDDGRDCIGRFLQVQISLDVREPLMRGTNVEFPDDGSIWVDFCYEGLPSYCLIYGKVGHVTRLCREGNVSKEALEFGMDERFAFKGF